MRNLKKSHDDFKKNHVYQYVMGLYHESFENNEKAMKCFDMTKSIDPSFSPVYNALKRCHLAEAKAKKNKSILSGLFNRDKKAS